MESHLAIKVSSRPLFINIILHRSDTIPALVKSIFADITYCFPLLSYSYYIATMGSLAGSAVVVVLLISCVYLEPVSSAPFKFAFASSGVSYKSCSKLKIL